MKKINSYKEKKPEEDFTNLTIEEKILRFTPGYSVPEGISKEQAFEKLFQRIESGEKSTRLIPKNYRYLYWSIAASLLLVAGIFFIYQNYQTDEILAGNGSHVEYRLPDGSIVHLNAGSSISFAKYGFAMKRHLSLKGEGFFDVRKGNDFVINTLNGDVKVLGTTFNVISRNDLFKVSCLTGKVFVSAGMNSEIITPGETVVKINSDLKKSKTEEIEKLASWRKGEFYFENTPLIVIFEEIERQFNVKLEVSDVEKRFFTGNFSNKNLTETLDIVCIPMQLDYDIQTDKTIIVHKKK